jgi:ribosomal protein S18 acetylase RimI-like enzyme
MVQIREARFADLGAIATLHAESWRTFYRGIWSDSYLDKEVYKDRYTIWENRLHFPKPNQHVFLATENDTLLGFACLYIDDSELYGSYIDNLHVAAFQHGMGLGKQLMKACATSCLRYSSKKNLYLWVLEENSKARKFYEHLGGIAVEVINEQHPDGSFSNACRYCWKDISKL